jgi:basic amino acid/polyamine antiporter, APA family
MSDLKKALNTRGLTMIAVGACIGSGIFVTPASTMQHLPHHGWAILAWFIGGLISFLGAMTFAELGTRFTREGGVYVYLKEAYGDLAGFLYGWITLFIVNTGALAALAITLVTYLGHIFQIDDAFGSFLAIFFLWVLTIINIFGVKFSQHITNLFSSLKLMAMLFVVIVGIYFFPSMEHTLTFDLTQNVPEHLMQGILMAFVGVFWSMGGWHHASYLSGEAIDPQRTVPRAMLFGTSIVIFVYIAIILAYMVLLPMDAMSSSSKVAGDAVGTHLSWGGLAISIAICISVMGSIAIYTMSAPRIYFAMAKDKIFFHFLAYVSPKYGTPVNAMVFQTAWATVLILVWGQFDKLATFVTFMDIVFMALATATIFIFRSKDSQYDGFKVRPYPWIPLLYLLVVIAFVVNTLVHLKQESWSGMLILVAGLPFYYYFKNKTKIVDGPY